MFGVGVGMGGCALVIMLAMVLAVMLDIAFAMLLAFVFAFCDLQLRTALMRSTYPLSVARVRFDSSAHGHRSSSGTQKSSRNAGGTSAWRL